MVQHMGQVAQQARAGGHHAACAFAQAVSTVVMPGYVPARRIEHASHRLVAADVFAQPVHDLHRAQGLPGGRPAAQVQAASIGRYNLPSMALIEA